MSTADQVRERANYLCEYCHTSEWWQYVPFTIDHIVPVSLGGADHLENLALACFHCNRYKSNMLEAIDPESGRQSTIFNPRAAEWRDHFAWSADKLTIVGLTASGRATIALLQMNRERLIRIREADLEVGRHPPQSDL